MSDDIEEVTDAENANAASHLWEREGLDTPDITQATPDPKKDTLHDYALTMMAERFDKSEAKVERLNNQLVTATDRELMLRKDMDALKAHVERIRSTMGQLSDLGLYYGDGSTIDHETMFERICVVETAMRATPTQSLAAIKKRVCNDNADLLKSLNTGALSQYHCARILQQKAEEAT